MTRSTASSSALPELAGTVPALPREAAELADRVAEAPLMLSSIDNDPGGKGGSYRDRLVASRVVRATEWSGHRADRAAAEAREMAGAKHRTRETPDLQR